jgi:hypothetical protein
VATITKTINASGGDFASFAAAETAINAGTVSGVSAADVLFVNVTQGGDHTSTFKITANPQSLSALVLSVDPSVRHTGLPGTGVRLVSSNTQRSILAHSVAALPMTVEWLEVGVTGAGKLAAGWDLTAAFSSGVTHTARNCFLRGNGAHSTSPFRTCGIGNPGSPNSPVVCNLNVIDTLISDWKSGSTANAVGITCTNAATTLNLLNVTIDDIDVTGGTSGTVYGILTGNQANKTVKNTVVTQIGTNTTTGTKACFSGFGGTSTTGTNASSDGSAPGTGSLTSIIRGNNFNAPNSGDFRPLNDGAPIFGVGADLGTTPAGVNIDLTGRDRDSTGDSWSIGAYQLSAGGAVSNGVTLTTPTAYTIRQQVAGAASHTVSGTYTGTPTNVEVQLNGGSWATLQAGPTGGTFSGSVSIPTGVNTVAVRFSNDTGTTASVSNILVGDVFLVMGQSNADGRLTNQQTFAASGGNTAAVFDFDDTAWRLLADPTSRTGNGTYWPLVATTILANHSIPVGFVCAAEGGTSMSQWWATTAQARYTSAKARATLAGITAFAAALWDQGESDAINDVLQATYNANLDGLAGDVLSTYGCPLICALTGTTTGIDAGTDLDEICKAQIEAWGDNTSAVKPGPVGIDRAGLHWVTNTEAATIAGRWYQAVAAVLYGGGNARGPRVSSATLNQARTQISVVFDKTLKTGLTLSTVPWAVSDNGTPATVSGATYTGSTVTLTLSGALSGGAGTCTLSFGNGNTADGNTGAGRVVPLGNAADQPAEPIYAQAVSEYVAASGGRRSAGMGLGLGLGL